MIVTIDGPAGAGKSTVARLLAHRLGFTFLDTGALYRTVTLAGVRAGIDPADQAAMRSLLARLQMELRGDRAFLNSEDVSEEIRSPEITRAIQGFADASIVRDHVTNVTRQLAQDKNVVTEGRDQGTAVFPRADVKFFLVARDEVRAERRRKELAARGIEMSLAEVLDDQGRRDAFDAARPSGGLVRAADAHLVDSSSADIKDVIITMERIVKENV